MLNNMDFRKVSVNVYLDARRAKSGQAAPLKMRVTLERKTAYLPLEMSVLPEHWDADRQRVSGGQNREKINRSLSRLVSEANLLILEMREDGRLAGMDAIGVRDEVRRALFASDAVAAEKGEVATWFGNMISAKSARTRELYVATQKRIEKYIGEEAFPRLSFRDVTPLWLTTFDAWMRDNGSPGANARAIHMRNIRAVFNLALDNEATELYPFRRFKIQHAPTRKRNFDAETMRRILLHRCDEEWQQRYLDFFKLTFYLIGINAKDLCLLQDMNGDRVEYVRAKTHKPYSIKVEPEALEIINRYRGENYLLSYMDTNSNYRSFYMNLTVGLRAAMKQLELPELTTYWARHSWATIARRIGIGKDTIARALGHSMHDVTDVYIEYDAEEVDAANRRVIDFVLYGKQKKRGRHNQDAFLNNSI